ncbi:MAG TPA: LytTR family DNA-binding domain-containing protein [Bryobacteraceae bacterium]|nr:LytTR family DNA-binding domain-containing protein [Bryobacteraceae bacterium]
MALRTLIVDDEPIARDVLRQELESIPDVEVVGEAENGAGALVQISLHKPDLVLLDLQMPGMGGLEVIRNLRSSSHVPVFVVTTAHDAYAIRAFEEGAIDYLLKPVHPARLAEAVERARRIRGGRAAEKLAQLQEFLEKPGLSGPKKIVGKREHEYFLLSSAEILAFEAEGDIVWIITAREKYRAEMTLKALEELLITSGFRRIHRNALVNVDHVRKLSVLSSQRWLITLSNSYELVASKRLVRSLRALLRV